MIKNGTYHETDRTSWAYQLAIGYKFSWNLDLEANV